MFIGDVIHIVKDKNIKLEFPRRHTGFPEIKKGLTKSLQRSPKERYKTADEILKDLNGTGGAADEDVERAVDEIRKLYCDVARIEIAESKFSEILRRHPGSPRIYLNIGEFYNKCGGYEKAVEAFKKGLEVDPENAILHWGLATAYQRKTIRPLP